jgi:hypothetical protein
MANKKVGLKAWLMAAVLMFGIMVITCSNQVDKSSNGTWSLSNFELSLKNGNFEETIGDVSWRKGTYTAKNGELMTNPTHIFGSGYNKLLGLSEDETGIEAKWYSMDDFLGALKSAFIKMGDSESDVKEFMNIMKNSVDSADSAKRTYNLNGNTLSITVNGQTQNFTKK